MGNESSAAKPQPGDYIPDETWPEAAPSAARRRLYLAWFVVLVVWPAILCAPLYIPELRS